MFSTEARHSKLMASIDSPLPNTKSGEQLQLLIDRCPHRAADQLEAARRVFESVLAVAERICADQTTAVQAAIKSAYRRTGIDLAKEVSIDLLAPNQRRRAALERGDMRRLVKFLRARSHVPADEICERILQCDPSDRRTRMRVSEAMRSMGWNKTRQRTDGARKWFYHRATIIGSQPE